MVVPPPVSPQRLKAAYTFVAGLHWACWHSVSSFILRSPMGMSAFIIRDGDDQHRTLISDRDIGLLSGPLFTEGPIFSFTYGFYENFTVARGIPPGSHVVRPAQKLYNAASALLRSRT